MKQIDLLFFTNFTNVILLVAPSIYLHAKLYDINISPNFKIPPSFRNFHYFLFIFSNLYMYS